MPTVSVVIPARNKWELTRGCLDSLARTAPPDSLEVILVDNASGEGGDETPTQAEPLGRALFPGAFRYLRQERNINFGPACNLGASQALGDVLFFLNNDTTMTEGWLPPLLEGMDRPGTAGVGPLLLYPDDTVQHLGIVINPVGHDIGHLYAGLPARHRLVQKSRAFAAVTAAALMLPRQAFLQAGEFDPAYVNGFEDVDLCFRMASQGKRFSVIPESVVYHLESQSAGRHAEDEHNGRLLSSRWDMREFSNMEEIALADGYDVMVDMALKTTFAPRPERLPALLASMRGPDGPPDPARAAAVLADEPYWEEGHALLAGMLETAGNLEAACSVLCLSLERNPGFQGLERLLGLARRLPAGPDKAQLMGSLAPLYESYAASILDEPEYTRRLNDAVSWLEAKGRRELAARYRQAGKEAAAFRASRGV